MCITLIVCVHLFYTQSICIDRHTEGANHKVICVAVGRVKDFEDTDPSLHSFILIVYLLE